MTQKGDLLIARMVADSDDAPAHALLTEFFSGHPVDELRQLLLSDDEGTARTGAWIASELGWRSRPLIGVLAQLLNHPSKYVRFYAIDSILAAGSAEHGEAISAAVQRVEDVDDAVRWKAINFIAQAAHDQLVASLPFQRRPAIALLTRWLLDCDQSKDGAEIVARLDSSDSLERLFACIAAVRVSIRDRTALERAAVSTDVEVSSFALEQLDALQERDRTDAQV
ncbi:MAG: hypothetical protein AVDCRST_MAG68-4473 [uncultured Gemmatimonadetes bacterium]|uniref:HEAT repeat domain-containing protein n=1 Tax=uncultured Gemmatimonadota bacterium TaxID=203437 RepID=A0A6J4MLV0_9BACT|nr:MAG: hypothetical protein AVDCRST_MAG68-4473 [uncultured Gemmatimonadota bacterium]